MQEGFLYVFPAAFPALALAHFVALLSPGPDFFLILGNASRHRLRGSALICLGIALGNAIYIALAIISWAGLKENSALYRLMELGGAAYLLWMGWRLWKAGARPVTLEAAGTDTPKPDLHGLLSPPAQLAAGLGSALLNPKNAIFYLTLMTVIIGPEASLAQQAAAGAWMTLVVLAWDLLVAGLLSHPAMQERIKARIPLVERLAAIVLSAMAFGLIASVIQESFLYK